MPCPENAMAGSAAIRVSPGAYEGGCSAGRDGRIDTDGDSDMATSFQPSRFFVWFGPLHPVIVRKIQNLRVQNGAK